MKLFLSYARVSAEAVENLVVMLKREYCVWYDREIKPGQEWWNEIINEIQNCDRFIVALTPEWLSSIFCTAEWQYAQALNKPIIPVEIASVDRDKVPSKLKNIQWCDSWTNQDLLKAIHSARPPLAQSLKTPPSIPPMPVEPFEELKERVECLRPSFKQQRDLLGQIQIYLEEGVWDKRARGLLEELHAHQNVLASIRDQIEVVTPALGTPRLHNRVETNDYEAYSDFIDKAQQTIHNYGAGLYRVGEFWGNYQAAITRRVRLHFMLLNPDLVTDATARFFGKRRREQICNEIGQTLKVYLTQLSDHAESIGLPAYKYVMKRWRETGPDIGILARDLDCPNGVMRVEFHCYKTNPDHRLGFLLYPNQELYRTFKQVITELWANSDQSVAAAVTSPDKPGQILLTLRSTELEQFGGMWCLPGGHVDVGEYNIEAIVREVREETGLEFDPHYFDQFEENYPEYQHHVWVNAYVGDVIGGNPNRQEAEVTQMQWFALDEACEMALAFGHEKILRAYRDREKLYRLESRWIRR